MSDRVPSSSYERDLKRRYRSDDEFVPQKTARVLFDDDDLFSCGICTERYSVTDCFHSIRILPCGHDLCASCYVGLIKNDKDDRCPTCMSQDTSNFLKVPYILRTAIERAEENRIPSSRIDGEFSPCSNCLVTVLVKTGKEEPRLTDFFQHVRDLCPKCADRIRADTVDLTGGTTTTTTTTTTTSSSSRSPSSHSPSSPSYSPPPSPPTAATHMYRFTCPDDLTTSRHSWCTVQRPCKPCKDFTRHVGKRIKREFDRCLLAP